MFFVSNLDGEQVEVTDTKDGVAEIYPKDYIKSIAKKYKIIGVKDEGIKSYSYEQIAKVLVGRLNLLCSTKFSIAKRKDGLVHFGIEDSSQVSDIQIQYEVIQIPFGVQVLEHKSFAHQKEFKVVKFPPSLRCINSKVFKGCESLSGIIDIPSVFEFHKEAFANCTSLDGVVFSGDNNYVGERAFSGSGIKTIEFRGVCVEVENQAFSGCKGLVEVVNNHSEFKQSSSYMFANCINLKSFDLGLFRGSPKIEGYCFSNCKSLSKVLNSGIIKEVDKYAFDYCRNLKDFDFRNVITVGECAFRGTNIESIYAPHLKVIEECAFSDCTSLTKVKIDKSVEEPDISILDGVFKDCACLSSFRSEKQIGIIGNECFANCTELSDVKFGEYVIFVGNEVFSKCSRLRNLGDLKMISSCGLNAFMHSGLTEVDLTIKSFSGETKISGYGLFAFCTELKSVKVKMPYIMEDSFRGCTSLEYVEWDSDDKNAHICKDAFTACQNLKELHLPKTVKYIDAHAFKGCNKLERVYIPAEANVETSVFGTWVEIIRG